MSLNAVDIRHVWLCFLYSYIPSHSSFLRLPLETSTPADWLVWCLSVCLWQCACLCGMHVCACWVVQCQQYVVRVLTQTCPLLWLALVPKLSSLSLSLAFSFFLSAFLFFSYWIPSWLISSCIDQCFVTFLVTAFSVPTSVKQANML